MTTKKNLIAVLLFLLVLAGSNVLTYVLTKNANEGKVPESVKTSSSLGADPTKMPSDTVSPTTIVKKPSDYIDRETKVRGILVKLQDGRYIIAGQESQNSGAITVDNEAKLNLDAKASVQTTDISDASLKPTSPVTITGKFIKDTSGNLILKASAISD